MYVDSGTRVITSCLTCPGVAEHLLWDLGVPAGIITDHLSIHIATHTLCMSSFLRMNSWSWITESEKGTIVMLLVPYCLLLSRLRQQGLKDPSFKMLRNSSPIASISHPLSH